MNSKSVRVQDYLEHTLQSIGRIVRYTDHLDESGFLASELVQDTVLRNIEIFGEASGKVLRNHPDFAVQHAEIPWQIMYTMRNRVSHSYDIVIHCKIFHLSRICD